MASRLTLIVLGAAMAAVLLSGCGRKGDPRLPEGQADDFPRTYPAGAPRADEVFFPQRRGF
jgi:predicted small lipoprotein YifL